jgi:hypothetical protein
LYFINFANSFACFCCKFCLICDRWLECKFFFSHPQKCFVNTQIFCCCLNCTLHSFKNANHCRYFMDIKSIFNHVHFYLNFWWTLDVLGHYSKIDFDRHSNPQSTTNRFHNFAHFFSIASSAIYHMRMHVLYFNIVYECVNNLIHNRISRTWDFGICIGNGKIRIFSENDRVLNGCVF